ncbi:uncharacterized protein ARMOST_18335 [Armillaria ostoyae]|uniref:HAT C-terminal dimerisation domain-containing protein n=1 Tax=Armillaria ostoyae TaxID=47428 RepID=A0A284S1H6_ARMOS|nr:uncharacterized protein ARMOST_18335 [Armillaria ostoyae]
MASSVSSERVFSGGGLTITKLRNRLRGDVVEALQLLKYALRNDNDYFRDKCSLAAEEALEDEQMLEEDTMKDIDAPEWNFANDCFLEDDAGGLDIKKPGLKPQPGLSLVGLGLKAWAFELSEPGPTQAQPKPRKPGPARPFTTLKGASANQQNRYGEVPLFAAFQLKLFKSADILLEFGADLDVAEADGITPRQSFIRCGPEIAAVVSKWVRRRRRRLESRKSLWGIRKE